MQQSCQNSLPNIEEHAFGAGNNQQPRGHLAGSSVSNGIGQRHTSAQQRDRHNWRGALRQQTNAATTESDKRRQYRFLQLIPPAGQKIDFKVTKETSITLNEPRKKFFLPRRFRDRSPKYIRSYIGRQIVGIYVRLVF